MPEVAIEFINIAKEFIEKAMMKKYINQNSLKTLSINSDSIKFITMNVSKLNKKLLNKLNIVQEVKWVKLDNPETVKNNLRPLNFSEINSLNISMKLTAIGIKNIKLPIELTKSYWDMKKFSTRGNDLVYTSKVYLS